MAKMGASKNRNNRRECVLLLRDLIASILVLYGDSEQNKTDLVAARYESFSLSMWFIYLVDAFTFDSIVSTVE